jgi:hypothetical protein
MYMLPTADTDELDVMSPAKGLERVPVRFRALRVLLITAFTRQISPGAADATDTRQITRARAKVPRPSIWSTEESWRVTGVQWCRFEVE